MLSHFFPFLQGSREAGRHPIPANPFPDESAAFLLSILNPTPRFSSFFCKRLDCDFPPLPAISPHELPLSFRRVLLARCSLECLFVCSPFSLRLFVSTWPLQLLSFFVMFQVGATCRGSTFVEKTLYLLWDVLFFFCLAVQP